MATLPRELKTLKLEKFLISKVRVCVCVCVCENFYFCVSL